MKHFTSLFILLLTTIVNAFATSDSGVSIVTFYPGAEIYELEGHTALRIRTPYDDIAVGYGNFDFNAPNFVYRFVKGETDYWVTAHPWQLVEDSYRRQGRRIVEQRIDMDSAQVQRLFELVSTNLQPENRVYRYNYVRDNCATRPLRMVEQALGDSIVLGPGTKDMQQLDTWRKLMTYYHRNYPWYQLGIDMVLGSGLDRKLNNRERAYAPALLCSQLSDALVDGRPVVSETIILNDAAADAAIEPATSLFLSPLFVLGVLALLVIISTIRSLKRRKLCRPGITLLNTLTGICGLVVTFLVFFSSHEATSPNWLYLWLNPLGLVIAVVVWIKSAQKLLLWLQMVNFALLIATALCMALAGQTMNVALVSVYAAAVFQSAACIYIIIKHLQTTATQK